VLVGRKERQEQIQKQSGGLIMALIDLYLVDAVRKQQISKNNIAYVWKLNKNLEFMKRQLNTNSRILISQISNRYASYTANFLLSILPTWVLFQIRIL